MRPTPQKRPCRNTRYNLACLFSKLKLAALCGVVLAVNGCTGNNIGIGGNSRYGQGGNGIVWNGSSSPSLSISPSLTAAVGDDVMKAATDAARDFIKTNPGGSAVEAVKAGVGAAKGAYEKKNSVPLPSNVEKQLGDQISDFVRKNTQ